LVYPRRLCGNYHQVATRYLKGLTPEQRQPILDELEGRFLAETKGMKPVYDEIRFLYSLCQLTRQGKFRPNLGIKVRDQRIQQDKSRKETSTNNSEQPPSQSDEQRKQRKASGLKHLAEMRRIIGQKSACKNQGLEDDT